MVPSVSTRQTLTPYEQGRLDFLLGVDAFACPFPLEDMDSRRKWREGRSLESTEYWSGYRADENAAWWRAHEARRNARRK